MIRLAALTALTVLPGLALAACASTLTAPGSAAAEKEQNAKSANESVDLVYLREEEKLARDVYLALFERWQLPVFEHIAASEQRHLNLATAALERRGLSAENYSDKPGAFANDSLLALYNGFLEKGATSLTAALEVGATIEDLDIRDLDAMIAANPEPALLASLEKLRCASGNHMRAFTSQLERRGGAYRAQYISQTRLEEVLGQEHQRCGQMGKGKGMGHGDVPKGMGHGKGHGGKGMGMGNDKGGKGMRTGESEVHVIELRPADGAANTTKKKQVTLLLETPRLKIATITLRDGTVLPSHATPMPVTIQSLAGTGIVQARGKDYALSPGVLISLAPNEDHAVIPSSSADLIVLVHHIKVPGMGKSKH
ncbi:MAG: DUF2202 domain-containing protein [Hyphomicrobium sp.]